MFAKLTAKLHIDATQLHFFTEMFLKCKLEKTLSKAARSINLNIFFS